MTLGICDQVPPTTPNRESTCLCRRVTPVFHLVPTHRAQKFSFRNCDALNYCTPAECKAQAMAVDQKYYETPGHVIAAAVALSILDIVALFLRFYTRRTKNQGLKIDDWFLVPAAVFTVGVGISMVYGVSREALAYPKEVPSDYTGSPLDLDTEQLTITQKASTPSLVKASFLFFYMRIFVVNKKSLTNVLLIALIVFVGLWSVAFFFATLFECPKDFAANWGTTRELTSNCVNSMQIVLCLCVTDFVVDFAIICIPAPLVWRLNLCVAASLTRLVIEARAVAVGFAPDSDTILVITEYMYWGFVECAIGICAACLPTLQKLIPKDYVFRLRSNPKTIFAPQVHDRRQQFKQPFTASDELPMVPVPPGWSGTTNNKVYIRSQQPQNVGLQLGIAKHAGLEHQTPIVVKDFTVAHAAHACPVSHGYLANQLDQRSNVLGVILTKNVTNDPERGTKMIVGHNAQGVYHIITSHGKQVFQFRATLAVLVLYFLLA
ncbi:hypothetical protein LA080_012725 [Diaporthe eres]|nr:hypothetical protein LA080_012725 [Diaporthe eres]